MIGRESKQARLAALYEVEGILEERQKKRELTYEQQIALEHAKKLSKGAERCKKARGELDKLGILSDKVVIKLLEVMPKDTMLLKQVLAQEGKTFSDEEVAKVLSITKS